VIGVDLSEPGNEFAFLEEVAEDAGLPWRGPPTMERRVLELAGGGSLAAIAWGEAGAGGGGREGRGDRGRAGHDLVFLHGGAQNSHTWDTTLLALARPAVAIDLPGHGLSSWREDGRYAPEVIADDVRRGVETWAPAPRAIVGFSLGGLTALALAAEAPSLVPALVLVDVSPGPGAPGAPSPVPSLARTPDGWASREELWELATAAWPARSTGSLRRGIVHNTTVRDDGRVVWRHHFGNMTGGPGSFDIDRPRLWAALERVPGPVMLVRGGASTVVSDDDEAELRTRRPDAAVHVLDGLGHDIPGEAPLVLAGLIEEFLGDREGGTD